MTLIDELGLVAAKLSDTEFEVCLPLTDFHAQALGYLNGGVSLLLAEISAGMASNHLLADEQYFAVGQSISAEHLRAKKSQGQICAKGKLLYKGKSTHVWDIQMIDEKNELISHATVTNHIVKR
ncbi:PaaI family thioesterase [Lactovum odontotermitis]